MNTKQQQQQQRKNTPPGGIKPSTFRLTAERAKRLRHGDKVTLNQAYSLHLQFSVNTLETRRWNQQNYIEFQKCILDAFFS